MEERLREKQVVDPDAMVDIETKLLVFVTKHSLRIITIQIEQCKQMLT